MSASNEFDTNGAVFAVKLGVKNFLGYQDTLSFDCEKNISKSGADWSLGWQYQTLNDNQIQFQLRQSNSQILPFLNSTNQEISASYKNDTVQWSLSNCYRSNTMQKDDSVMGQYLYNEYLRNSDFMPSKAWILNYSRGLNEKLIVEDGITDGNKSKFNLQLGLPKCTTSPFVKAWLSHQYYIPLRDYRKKIPRIKEILKNSSLCIAFNYGLVWSPNLVVNDLFGNLQFRGFNAASRLNQSAPKTMDSFFKMDCKFVVHNNGSFKDNNVQLFYYLSLFALGQPQRLMNNVRGSFGVGLSMPVGNNINLEALIPLSTWRRKYDRETLFQVRIQLDD